MSGQLHKTSRAWLGQDGRGRPSPRVHRLDTSPVVNPLSNIRQSGHRTPPQRTLELWQLPKATKGAVDAVTAVPSKEQGPRKIRVNSINPGGVETEGVHTMGIIGTDFQKEVIAATPLGRFGQPDDIAPIAVFLASENSGWLTGETLPASGGYR